MQFIFGFSGWVGLMLYGGWVLTLLWSWFITPFGVTPITVPWGIGLMCVGSLFKSGNLPDEDFSPWLSIFVNAAVVTTALVVGFVASKFL